MADRANTGGKGRGVERDHRLLAHARPRDRRLAKHLSHRHTEENVMSAQFVSP